MIGIREILIDGEEFLRKWREIEENAVEVVPEQTDKGFQCWYIGVRRVPSEIGEGLMKVWESYSRYLMKEAPGAPREGDWFVIRDVMEFEEKDNVWAL